MYEYDVIVIGAGLAGATVARECATRGLRTVVLEGRDRIGGRAWTVELDDGTPIDIGGTYFSWNQPHLWSELTRYGLVDEVVDAIHDPAEWAYAPGADGLIWETVDEHVEREMPVLERFFEQSWETFPKPYDSLLARDAVARLDHMTVKDRLDELDFSPAERAMITSLLITLGGDSVEITSFVSMLKWWAAAGHSYALYYQTLNQSKLKNGILSLITPMLADGGAELRLSTTVTGVTTTADGCEVKLANGVVVAGKVVVLATPTGVWPHLEFSPPLEPERLKIAAEGLQTSRGSKSVAVIRGESRIFACTPEPGHPFSAIWTSHKRSEDEQVVTMMNSSALIDPEDPVEVEAAIKSLFPDAELIELHSSKYDTDDEFTRGGWGLYHPGQLSAHSPHETLSRPEGRLVFATADIAANWNSFLDGAIESGLRAARDVRGILS
ncbi:flavin monoamine oxidase family protein [Nocardia tengchongensis]|uniref:flavin monoamine oxidase family protein n=1 Tax=Nocardia tengchongensis TaxID=2055889 RepID=UPI0036922A06